jgi:hypothetical protein
VTIIAHILILSLASTSCHVLLAPMLMGFSHLESVYLYEVSTKSYDHYGLDSILVKCIHLQSSS